MNNVRNRFQSLEKLLPIPYYANAAFLDPRSKKACFTNQQNANDAEASIISEIVGLVQNQTTGKNYMNNQLKNVSKKVKINYLIYFN